MGYGEKTNTGWFLKILNMLSCWYPACVQQGCDSCPSESGVRGCWLMNNWSMFAFADGRIVATRLDSSKNWVLALNVSITCLVYFQLDCSLGRTVDWDNTIKYRWAKKDIPPPPHLDRSLVSTWIAFFVVLKGLPIQLWERNPALLAVEHIAFVGCGCRGCAQRSQVKVWGPYVWEPHCIELSSWTSPQTCDIASQSLSTWSMSKDWEGTLELG